MPNFYQEIINVIAMWGELLVALWNTGRHKLCMQVAKEVMVAINECRLK